MPVHFKEPLLSTGVTDQLLVARLQEMGVEASPLSALYWSGDVTPRQGLFLGYAASDEAEIVNGVDAIARCLDAFTP